MSADVEFTTKATALLLRMRAKHRNLVVLLDDTSCCSNSNVMVRKNPPSWPVDLLSEKDGVRVYVNPVLRRSLQTARFVIDALDFADDSFSLETDYGKRFFMSTAS